jgi:hypothetical protein
MKLYRGVPVGVCVGTVLYLCGRRSCGVTEGATGGRNSRVCGNGVGGDRGRTWERGIGTTGGSKRGGWLSSRIVRELSGGGFQTVVGLVVGGWLGGWIVCGRCVGRGARGLQLLATTVSVSSSLSYSTRIRKGLLCRVSR